MSLVLCSPYSRTPSLHPLLSSGLSLSCLSSGQKHQKQGKTGQKLDFLWCALVFSREIARPKGAKSKYIFERWVQVVQVSPALLAYLYCVHLGMWSGNSCYFADVSKIGQDSAGRPAFCPLYCFAFGALLANMALFRVLRGFSAGFGALVWVCVGCVLFVACGAFVCVNS